jgi:hypothetical protein
MAKKLTISISEYDSDIKDIVVPALQGGVDVTLKKYSTLPDLSTYEGDNKYPLTLLGHANALTFKTGVGLGNRVNGKDVADNLIAKNLKANTFPFCLIAGCSGAADKKAGLYITIGNILKIPVIASSTNIKISRVGEELYLTPQSSGVWRVYFPESEERFEFTTSRCDAIRALMDKQEFKCKLGVP